MRVPTMVRWILGRITFFSMIVILVVSVIAYAKAYDSKSSAILEAKKQQVAEKIKMESQIFILAERNLEVFEDEFLRLYSSETVSAEEDFWRYFFRDDNGAIRLKKQYYEGVYEKDGSYVYGMSGFIGNNQSVNDPALQRKILLTYKVIARLGPAWSKQFPNLTASFPENVGILFYPGELWGLHADAGLRMNELSVFKSVMPENNPRRKPVWTGLYYDETAKEWVVSYMKPIDYKGQYVISPGHDIHFSSMIHRLTEGNVANAYNFIMRQDGYLIAYPSQPQQEQKWIGELSLDKIAQPSIVDKYLLIREKMENYAPGEVFILEEQKNDDYLIVGKINGPEWLYISVYPKEIVRKSAMEYAVLVFMQGTGIMVLLLLIVYLVLLMKAQKPISLLTNAALVISSGDYKKVADNQVKLPIESKDEIGLLSQTFVNMASSIEAAKNNLEELVAQRTRELAMANQRLSDLSYMDTLTGSYNRRAFDRDMDILFQKAKQGEVLFSLLVLDLDYFKLYNDFYGHQKGDRILIEVTDTVRKGLGPEDKLYRYGGEEFVVVFCDKNKQTAGKIAEKIIGDFSKIKIPHKGSPLGFVTFSAGIAEYDENLERWEQVVEQADRKMYVAKARGRHGVIL